MALERSHSSCLACHTAPDAPTCHWREQQCAGSLADGFLHRDVRGRRRRGRGALTRCPPEHDILSTRRGQTHTDNRRSVCQEVSCWVGCVWYKTCLKESLE